MELFAANLSRAVPRRATLHGRPHLVAPLTLIVPGVLNGSQGSLYYPPEEIARNYQSWNGTPIVVFHPQGNRGEHVSARTPEVLDRQGVGVVLRSRVSNGRLKAEGWFDLEALQKIDGDLLKNMESGKPVELSTGLYTDNETAAHGAKDPKGRPYTHVARNYRPDHLAILPGQVGACSLDDGCGVNVNVQQVHSKNTGRFKRLGAGTGKGDVHEYAQMGAFDLSQLTDEDRELGKIAASDESAGRNPPSWAPNETIWAKAKKAADKGKYTGDSYYAVAAHIYKNMGGTIKTKPMKSNAFCPTGEGGGIDPSCGSEGGGSAKASSGGRSKKLSRKEGFKLAMKATQTAERLGAKARGPAGYLKAASAHEEASKLQKKYASEDQAVMHKNTARHYRQLASKEGQARLRQERYIDPGQGFDVNTTFAKNIKNRREYPMTHDELINQLIENSCCWNEEDRELLDGMEDEKLQLLNEQLQREQASEAVVNAARQVLGKPKLALNEMPAAMKKAAEKMMEDEDEEGEDEEKETKNMKTKAEEEWLAQAPAGVREDIQFARNERARQKSVVVARLIANHKGEEKERLEAALNRRSLDELKELEPLAPAEPEPNPFAANWVGAAPAPQVTNNRLVKRPEPMPVPSDYIYEMEKQAAGSNGKN